MPPYKKPLPAPYTHLSTNELHDLLMKCAVHLYKMEQSPSTRDKNCRIPMGYRAVCSAIQDEFLLETGITVSLSHNTLHRWVEGKRTRAELLEQQQWLMHAEEKAIVAMCIEMARIGFPWSYSQLKEHVDLICIMKYGGDNPICEFPEEGVGVNWTHHFLKRHEVALKTACSAPLEMKHGRAVNPEANARYWELLKKTIIDFNIKPHNIYGSDKCGVIEHGTEREVVIAGRGTKGPIYQQRSGSRDNTTVIVTICADGTYIQPTIIFKGKAFRVKWVPLYDTQEDDQVDNPRIGYQEKGWTNGEIGAAWLADFDKQTVYKLEEGEYRLLLVD
ncbi:hypothetical protein CVT24_006495 [Panaeolus cyanescens]|uniref:DDE-1 domain-containing protein n=1 Tax=Panaeolus cyanescens TaxID=181874 RepID=A0A409X377_9AGAR|nr:hypothetical protein CVT24_006495 [Panaeolus cyanescens]